MTVCETPTVRRNPRPRPRQISVTSSLMSPVAGAKIFQEAEYEFESLIGRGTFATVKLGRRNSDGKLFAFKVFCATDEEMQDAVLKEHRIQAGFRHRCIVSVEALYISGRTLYLCLEYSEGGSVDSYIKRHGPMCEQTAQHLFSNLLEGVDHIHCKRVVHRDLKPHNLVLDADARSLKITDFGSATELTSNKNSNMLTTHAGTALYFAPEVHFGYNWNERVDIWACGLCFHVMLRGDLPFDLESRKVRRTLQKGRLPDWSAHSFSLLTRDILQQCLKVAVWDRPPAMELRLHPMFKSELENERSFGRQLSFGRQVSPETPEVSSGFSRSTTPGDSSPKTFASILKGCGLICVYPYQDIETPSTNGGKSLLQALADVKCLRNVETMSRNSSKGVAPPMSRSSSKPSLSPRSTTGSVSPTRRSKETSYTQFALESGSDMSRQSSVDDPTFDRRELCENTRKASKRMGVHLQNGSIERSFSMFLEEEHHEARPWERQWSTDT